QQMIHLLWGVHHLRLAGIHAISPFSASPLIVSAVPARRLRPHRRSAMLPRGNLRIGRVGLDVELNEPQFLDYRGTRDGRQLNISGYLRAETLEETQLLRNELIAQIGKLVTVAYDTDDTLNGAAIITDADIDIRWT